jgi:DNA-dependent protein kinase catalytic subunit
LADSSLSQDVTNSAFFERDDGADNAQTGGSDAMDVDTPDNAQQPAPDEPPVELSVSKADQSIELDSINSNPCMMAILSLIDDMVKKFGPANAQVAIASRAEMPGWMKEMHKKFTSASTHMNIKLFMVKVIANKPEAFEAWADQWFKPITKMMIQLQLELRLEGLHYFLRDICICFLKWPNFVPSAGAEDRRVATNLIEFLFRNAIWPVRSIMIANIQIIRLMIERWRSHISPSKNVVLEYLSQDGSKQRMNKVCRVAGLQLLDALIANGFELHHPEYDQNVSKVVLVDQLLGNLAYGAKDVYKAGSEVCGRILEVLDPLDKPTFETLLKDKVRVYSVIPVIKLSPVSF